MFAAIRRYTMQRGSIEELGRDIEANFLPTVTQIPGFISYQLIDEGPGAMATISVFEDESGVRASTERATAYVREHFADAEITRIDVIEGAVVLHREAAAAGR